MSKPMSKKTTATLAGVLWLLGVTFIGTVFFQLKNPVLAVFMLMGAGLIHTGAWLGTVANAMKGDEGDKPAKPSSDS